MNWPESKDNKVASYVLDTSAIMCVLFGEQGASQVMAILTAPQVPDQREKSLVIVPFVALMETEYWLLRRRPAREVERTLFLVENWPVTIVESTEEWRHEAARIKAGNRLSLADAWIASLAILQSAQLVHKDPEFDLVVGLESLRLPNRKHQSDLFEC